MLQHEALLHFLYTGQLWDKADAKELKALLVLADTFAVPTMVDAVTQALIKIMTVELAVDVLCNLSNATLLAKATAMILDEYKTLENKALPFHKLPLQAVMLLLKSDTLLVDSENHVWRLARFWVLKNKVGNDVAIQVFSAIRLHNISRNYFCDCVLRDTTFFPMASPLRQAFYEPTMRDVLQFHALTPERQMTRRLTLRKRAGYVKDPTTVIEWKVPVADVAKKPKTVEFYAGGAKFFGRLKPGTRVDDKTPSLRCYVHLADSSPETIHGNGDFAIRTRLCCEVKNTAGQFVKVFSYEHVYTKVQGYGNGDPFDLALSDFATKCPHVRDGHLELRFTVTVLDVAWWI